MALSIDKKSHVSKTLDVIIISTHFCPNLKEFVLHIKDKTKVYYFLVFLIFVLCLKILLMFDGRALVWLYDGTSQHLSALTYYSNYLKEIFSGIFSGNFSIPRWDLAVGEGSDILTTFHYYCIGDPLAFICVFFPEDLMYVCYELLIYARLLISGYAFMYFVKVYDGGKLKEKVSDTSLLAATVLYTFSSWMTMMMTRHAFFNNPMIYMPLLLAGVELIMKKCRRGFFAIIVMLSSLTNLYFFYIMAFLTVVYVIIRFAFNYGKNIKDMLRPLLTVVFESVTGVLMSAIIFYPVAKVFLSDSRVGGDGNLGIFYPLEYYLSLPQAVISGNWSYYLLIGAGAAGVMSLYFIIARKGNRMLKVILAVAALFLIFPFFGLALNGFAYATNRWCFAVPLIFAVSLLVVWDDICNLGKKDIIILAVIFLVAGASSIYAKDTNGIVFSVIGIIAAVLIAVMKDTKIKNRILCGTVLLSLPVILIFQLYPFLEQLAPPAWLKLYYGGSEAKYIASGDDTRPLRYSGNILTENISPLAGISSTQFYWSNANPHVSEFRTDTAMPEYRLYYYGGYDSSNILLNLSGSKYYAESGEHTDPAPYGFTDITSMEIGYTIKKNDLPASLVYTYDKVVDKSLWDKLNPTDRQMLISEAMVMPQSENKELSLETTAVKYEVTARPEGGTRITFEGQPKSETYVTMSNVKAPYNDRLVYVNVAVPQTGESYVFSYYTVNNWYNGRNEFSINLGYHEEAINEVIVTVQNNLEYSCDYSVSCIDMNKATANLTERFKDAPAKINVESRGTKISFETDSDSAKYYVLAVPFAEGWKAYIDGAETEIINANIQYMGVNVPIGHHEISFVYEGDYKTAAIISGIGVLLYAGYLIYGTIRKEETAEG